jgi:hypothetical protein
VTYNLFTIPFATLLIACQITGSGRQRWTFNLLSGKTNVYNIEVSGGRSGCNTFLSSASCGSNLVDLYSEDDGMYLLVIYWYYVIKIS